MIEINGADRRRHVRSTMYEPCFVVVGDQEYSGAVVDMSMGGAAVQLEIQLDAMPAPDTAMQLQIEGMGKLRATVIRSRLGSVAIEFNIDARKEGNLLTALQRVLSH